MAVNKWTILKESEMPEDIDYSMWVLVVDDHPNIISLARQALNKLGFQNVDGSDEGTDALIKLDKKEYGLIISDLDMVPLDGMDLLRSVRKNINTRDIPFIMLTGNNISRMVNLALKEGANHYLVKPFSPTSLEDSIHRAFENKASKKKK